MKEFDFTIFEREIFPEWIKQFKSGSSIGDYSYHRKGPTSLYGSTDMLISKYILNQVDLSENEKKQWAAVINQFQDSKSGWYKKLYTLHYKEHTTAYAIAALYLIDQHSKYPLYWKKKIIESQKTMKKWINHPNWSFIWATSHIISGIPAALAMANEGTSEFFQWYFNWLNQEADPNSGFWMRGIKNQIMPKNLPRMQDLGGAFHMYYIYEFFNQKWLYPKKVIDHTLRLQHPNGLWDKKIPYCIDLDGLYSLLRSSRNANNYRQRDIQVAVEKFLATTQNIFQDRERFYKAYPNSHRLTGALSAIAECQKFYPQLVKTIVPWKQSLDKACFI